ncbi:hypothetical protein TYRP_022825 [Tyrophagus putrescentiae]|nr:hypothetical protein TYRP_022825 [Tyrophagus putrescentiae]
MDGRRTELETGSWCRAHRRNAALEPSGLVVELGAPAVPRRRATTARPPSFRLPRLACHQWLHIQLRTRVRPAPCRRPRPARRWGRTPGCFYLAASSRVHRGGDGAGALVLPPPKIPAVSWANCWARRSTETSNRARRAKVEQRFRGGLIGGCGRKRVATKSSQVKSSKTSDKAASSDAAEE